MTTNGTNGPVSPLPSTEDEVKAVSSDDDEEPRVMVGKQRRNRELQHFLREIKAVVNDFEEVGLSAEGPAALPDAPVTEKNWKQYLSYLSISLDDLKLKESLLPDDSRDFRRPIQLVNNKGRVEIEIWSECLQAIFLEVVDVSFYHGVAVSSSAITITPTYTPLFHELDRLKEAVSADASIPTNDRKCFEAMCYYIELDAPQKMFKDVRRLISQDNIMYDNIWSLFSKRSLVVSRDHLDNFEISRIVSVRFEEDNRYSGYLRTRWFVTTSSIVRAGGRYHQQIRRRRMETFDGVKKIRHLEFFPIEYLEDHEAAKALAVQRGMKWKKYCESEPAVMSYEGQALSVLRSMDSYISPDGATTFSSLFLSATIIVDPDAQSRLNKQAVVDEVPINTMEVNTSDTRSHRPLTDAEFDDEDYLRCPATKYVFDLDNHEWYSVNIMDIKPKEWHPESFDRLVMDPARKNILKRITTTSLDQARSASHDAIEGKGKGLVLLLYGPPGVGKTMTAEALAQLTHKPLLKVNLGRLSSHKRWEQALDQVFDNGEAWKAILLIDEAEVVLEKRTFERMIQNSWISVFLRKLEYYQGVLILTTNLIDCMDDAFESRISYPIQFEELSQEDRQQIWTGFIEHLSLEKRYKREILEHVDKWADAEINGRQIRNVFTMAENLAKSDGRAGRLTVEHIDKILEVTLEFTAFNRTKYSKKKKSLLAY